MEAVEIKQALGDFKLRLLQAQPLGEGELIHLMEFFLQQVLGYLQDEILKKAVQPCLVVPEQVEFDDQIKFLVVPHSGILYEEEVQQAARCALELQTNLLVLTNGSQFKVYNLDVFERKLELESLFELDLVADDPDEAAQTLWTLATKGCGRKVILATWGR